MYKQITSFILFMLISVTYLHAQKPIEILVWPNGAPEENGITTPENNESANRPSNISVAKLYVYPATNPNGMAIICCPGGGYTHLAMEHEGTDMVNWFNRQGITFAILKYRMPNGHKNIPVNDAAEAMRIMKKHAEEWKINPNQIGIMGSSAGGHLAASLACLSTEDTRPAFQILLYPVISMLSDTTHKGSCTNLLGENATQEDRNEFSMEQRVTSDTPKAFIALSGDDTSVVPANSLHYAQALLDANIPVSLHLYPTGGHGWGYRDSFLYKRQWTGELEKWLLEIIK